MLKKILQSTNFKMKQPRQEKKIIDTKFELKMVSTVRQTEQNRD